jgi:2-alkyl-3-oxoalkanoate reductase
MTVEMRTPDPLAPIRGNSAPAESPSVLITGSSGFIGGHLFDRFAAMGWRVSGLGRRSLAKPGYFVHDLSRPVPDLPARPVDVVIHAAARASPWGRTKDFERQNVAATQHVVDYCRRRGFPRLVFLSSSSVYYRPCHQIGITEQTPLADQPVNAYAATKQRAEDLVRGYPGEWVILRPRAVFGPGDTVLLPRIIHAARSGRLALIEAPGGPARGDLIYIENLVDYVVMASQYREIKGCFNLTNGEPVAIGDFLLDVLRRVGVPPPRRVVSVRSAMVLAGLIEAFHAVFLPAKEPPITRFGIHVFAYSKTFDVSKMIAAMGSPRVSQSDGLETTIAWVRGNGLCPTPT